MRISAERRETIMALGRQMSRESIARVTGVKVGVVNKVLDGEPDTRPPPLRPGISRHGHAPIRPGEAMALKPGHPALIEGRTLFPKSVVGTAASRRFLVSGHNNPKLGKAVVKGGRDGWPIFHLTLEERVTCPTMCSQWASCYGNAMHLARRHRPDAAFLPNLRAEIGGLSRQHPGGLLIRLHTLGDFYSAEYVMFWAEILRDFPAVHVFGYTARRVDDPDPKSAQIARAIAVLTKAMWSRFSIRTSHPEVGAERAIVVETEAPAGAILCPTQTEKTAACATCHLCWAEGARDKTIAFLRHGMRRHRGPRSKSEPIELGNPAGETIPSSQGGPRAAEATTGDSPVASAPIESPAPAAPPPPKRPAPARSVRSIGRQFAKSAQFVDRGDGVQVVRLKPVTSNIVRWSRQQIALGATVADLAELFEVSPDALELALAGKLAA